MASAPAATARRASSASSTPFMMSFPGQRLRPHSTSPQLADPSNCVAIHSAKVLMPLEPPIRPTKLPNVRRLPNNTFMAHVGFVATSQAFRSEADVGHESVVRQAAHV